MAAINIGTNEIDKRNRPVAAVGNAAGPHDVGGAETPIVEPFVITLPLLRRIERYERRAYSRRKKAMTRLNDLRILSQLSPLDHRKEFPTVASSNSVATAASHLQIFDENNRYRICH